MDGVYFSGGGDDVADDAVGAEVVDEAATSLHKLLWSDHCIFWESRAIAVVNEAAPRARLQKESSAKGAREVPDRRDLGRFFLREILLPLLRRQQFLICFLL